MPVADRAARPSRKSMEPAYGGFVVTPNDGADLATEARSLYVGGTGNITLIGADGQSVLFSAIPVGTILPIRVKRVMATGTTATLIVAMY